MNKIWYSIISIFIFLEINVFNLFVSRWKILEFFFATDLIEHTTHTKIYFSNHKNND